MFNRMDETLSARKEVNSDVWLNVEKELLKESYVDFADNYK